MDKVRFGRALGYGARHAAQSLKNAAEAAAAPNPSSRVAAPQPAAHRTTQRVIPTPQKLATTKTHARALGRSVWSPLARFSSVVWLQVTGTFFTLLALFLSEGLWKERVAIKLPINSHQAEKFYIHLFAFVVFVYFAISNFIRAHQRERR